MCCPQDVRVGCVTTDFAMQVGGRYLLAWAQCHLLRTVVPRRLGMGCGTVIYASPGSRNLPMLFGNFQGRFAWRLGNHNILTKCTYSTLAFLMSNIRQSVAAFLSVCVVFCAVSLVFRDDRGFQSRNEYFSLTQ